MLILVMANTFLLMFVGWEGVGLASFLLIGFWFERAEATAAATKAFVVNRIGDVGLLLAMFALWKLTGTLAFREVFAVASERIAPMHFTFLGAQITAADAITLAILLAVTGKSAQIPLYVWLPDAMAGPTPVSALIHAATMVTAGVYLMVRSHALFALAPATTGLVAWVGALTALIGAVIAVGQYDIKKVLAYSTVSQLGYMVAAFGVGSPVAAMFHLLTQGFSKALLFLAAGSVMHGTNDTQDMRKMGGLKDKMPITFWTFVAGALSLAGIPIFASFWSKDEIIGAAFEHGKPGIGIILVVSAALTAFYMARQVSMVFLGRQRDPSYHPHESPPVMTVPLLILAVGTVLGGLINLPGLSPLQLWLFPLLEEPAGEFQFMIASLTVVLAVLGGWAGWRLYGQRPIIDAAAPDPLQRAAGGLFRVLEEKLWVDELYDILVVRPFRRIARFLGNVLDVTIIDGGVDGVAGLMARLSAGMRQLQTGYIRNYALMFLLGVVLLIGYFALR
jgi:NADH-quinone oxidoreductase subunit L